MIDKIPLRIGINALYLIPGGVGGTEIYLRSLLKAIAGIDAVNRYFIFTNTETGAEIVPAQPNFHHRPQHVAARIRPARILWEQIVLPFSAAKNRLDVLFNPGFTCPAMCPCPTVTVFHDLQHKRHPEHFRWFDLPFWRVLLYAAARRSTLLVAVSESTKLDLAKFYGIRDEKIRVIGHGVDPAFFAIGKRRRAQASIEAPYLLTVSTLHPHKNLNRLLQAFAQFHRTRPEFRLVIAGLRGFHAENLEKLRRSLGIEDAVRFTGWIPREELYELFAQANAFLYPSTFEGFGMPLLEAFATGLPTACSNIEPLASIAGDAAITFDPSDTSAIHRAMVSIASDEALRERLSAAGPARASNFTWEQSARLTLAALTGVAGPDGGTQYNGGTKSKRPRRLGASSVKLVSSLFGTPQLLLFFRRSSFLLRGGFLGCVLHRVILPRHQILRFKNRNVIHI